MRRSIAAAFLIALCLLPSLVLAQQEGERPDFATDRLAIETTSGARHVFDIEIARTNAERGYGLMFVREMAADRGMLFDYGWEQRVSMWMRNTYVPLDMLFIETDGEIESIIERAAPHTRTPRASKGRVLAVLELKGGTAQRLGIAPGDRVLHALFGTEDGGND